MDAVITVHELLGSSSERILIISELGPFLVVSRSRPGWAVFMVSDKVLEWSGRPLPVKGEAFVRNSDIENTARLEDAKECLDRTDRILTMLQEMIRDHKVL